MSCVKAYCVFGGFTLLPPSNFSLQTLLWFVFDRLQPCLTLTHSQPRSRLFNCLLLSLAHTHSRKSSSLFLLPSSPEILLATRWMCRCFCEPQLSKETEKKKGGLSQVCLLSPRCKLTRKKTLSRSVGCLSGFLSAPTLSLFRVVTRGV